MSNELIAVRGFISAQDSGSSDDWDVTYHVTGNDPDSDQKWSAALTLIADYMRYGGWECNSEIRFLKKARALAEQGDWNALVNRWNKRGSMQITFETVEETVFDKPSFAMLEAPDDEEVENSSED